MSNKIKLIIQKKTFEVIKKIKNWFKIIGQKNIFGKLK